jgi:Zn-dependent peptidase ImmA (M78 family)
MQEVMQMDDYRVTLANLPTSIRGFVFLESDGVPRIVLNANLTREQNRKTMKHELDHIERGELTDPTYDEYKE